jgi:lysophospholipid acyltransferase (LPLAT)-like uncharacterized protein
LVKSPSLLKALGKQILILKGIGKILAGYMRLVRFTSRVTYDPPDMDAKLHETGPMIAALWHGQHLMVPYAKPADMPFAVLISRHRDGEINASACRNFDIIPTRGSGGRPDQSERKGGAGGLRSLIRFLADGVSVCMTADVPKVARIAGPGIITLARLSQKPIVPIAVVSNRHHIFKSWDLATMGLPFGHLVIAMGKPIRVPRDCSEEQLEAYRLELQDELDQLHARAYQQVGSVDPGRHLREASAP